MPAGPLRWAGPILATILMLTVGLSARAEGWPEPPVFPEPQPAALEALARGEVLVENTRLDARGGAARARAVFHVDRERLWAVIGNCAANRLFVRGLLACEILEHSRTRAVTRQRLKPYTLFPAVDYEFETLRAPYEWIRIRLTVGDLRDLQGAWRFTDFGDGALLVTHEIHVQPALPVPRWLARRTVQRDLANLMACLRWMTRGTEDPRRRGLDRQACPEQDGRLPEPLPDPLPDSLGAGHSAETG